MPTPSRLRSRLPGRFEAANEKGVINLKPSNIKMTREGIIKVLNFGLAKAFDTSDASEPATPTGGDGALNPTGSRRAHRPCRARGRAAVPARH